MSASGHEFERTSVTSALRGELDLAALLPSLLGPEIPRFSVGCLRSGSIACLGISTNEEMWIGVAPPPPTRKSCLSMGQLGTGGTTISLKGFNSTSKPGQVWSSSPKSASKWPEFRRKPQQSSTRQPKADRRCPSSVEITPKVGEHSPNLDEHGPSTDLGRILEKSNLCLQERSVRMVGWSATVGYVGSWRDPKGARAA